MFKIARILIKEHVSNENNKQLLYRKYIDFLSTKVYQYICENLVISIILIDRQLDYFAYRNDDVE